MHKAMCIALITFSLGVRNFQVLLPPVVLYETVKLLHFHY